MLTPSLGVGADDDVSIRCRVRHSQNATNPEFDEVQEMSCTMRNWEPINGSSPSGIAAMGFQGSAPTKGPQLVICPIRSLSLPRNASSNHLSVLSQHQQNERAAAVAEGLHQRFRSFGSSPMVTNTPPSVEIPLNSSFDKNSRTRNEPPPIPLTQRSRTFEPSPRKTRRNSDKSFVIPIGDIIVVDVDGTHRYNGSRSSSPPRDPDSFAPNLLNIATLSHGYFEFTFHSRNSHDVMLVFLESTLPPERITRINSFNQPGVEGHYHDYNVVSVSDVEPSFDMEYITAREINECVEPETFTERVKTRMNNVVSAVGEFYVNFSECVCGHGSQLIESPKVDSDLDRQSPLHLPSRSCSQSQNTQSRTPLYLFSYEESFIADSMRDSAPTRRESDIHDPAMTNKQRQVSDDRSSTGSSFSRTSRKKKNKRRSFK